MIDKCARAAARILGISFLYLVVSGHIGSPDTWFEGNAGPYRIAVHVETAGVVPGVANIFVRVAGDGVERVTIQANKFDATGGAPPSEPAEQVAGDPGLFAGKLWLMSGGSNSLTINLSGAKGAGSVVVPVVAVAYSRLGMKVPMAVGLAAMGVFLFMGMVTIVGAAVRESVLPPGEAPTEERCRSARKAMVVTGMVLVALVAGGARWWQAEDARYVRRMYKPLNATASIEDVAGGRLLKVAITDTPWVNRNNTAWLRKKRKKPSAPLLADHGKLMHLFLIRDDLAAFAHLHPTTTDSVAFPSRLPPLPSGKYRIFADIVLESGFTHTMVTSAELGARGEYAGLPTATGTGQPTTDNGQPSPDDSWFAGPVVRGASTYSLEGEATMVWAKGDAPIVAGRPASLRFEIRNTDGSPAKLDPYMGMAGHAVVARDDGSVFVHLHPAGTISMASQMAFAMREPGDTIRGRLGKRISGAEMSTITRAAIESNVVSFPYAFPKPGNYRVWVQVKRGDRILTGAFDVVVGEAAPAPG